MVYRVSFIRNNFAWEMDKDFLPDQEARSFTLAKLLKRAPKAALVKKVIQARTILIYINACELRFL